MKIRRKTFFSFSDFLFKSIQGHLGMVQVLCLLTPAENWVQSPAAMPLALCFNEPILQFKLKLAKAHVPVSPADHLWCSLNVNT